jgi:hypothetical protein
MLMASPSAECSIRQCRGADPPRLLSTDNEPLFKFHRWQASLRILDVKEIKSVSYVPMSHPFIERMLHFRGNHQRRSANEPNRHPRISTTIAGNPIAEVYSKRRIRPNYQFAMHRVNTGKYSISLCIRVNRRIIPLFFWGYMKFPTIPNRELIQRIRENNSLLANFKVP